MDPRVIGAIVVVLALVIIGLLLWQRQRTEQLQSQFGVEYDRTVAEMGRRRAEAELAHRRHRVEKLAIRSLSAGERDRFAAAWRTVQAEFVDDPEGAVAQGHRLVDELMRARGYPVADFDQRMADLSVDHPRVVQNYRAARAIARRHAAGEATTEDLREAMVYYRELFEDLLEDRQALVGREGERVVARAVERDVGAVAGEPEIRRTRPGRELRP